MAQALVLIMQCVHGVVSYTEGYAVLGQQPVTGVGRRDTCPWSVLEQFLWHGPSRLLRVVWHSQQLQPQHRLVAEAEGEGQPLLHQLTEGKVRQLQHGSSQ